MKLLLGSHVAVGVLSFEIKYNLLERPRNGLRIVFTDSISPVELKTRERLMQAGARPDDLDLRDGSSIAESDFLTERR